MTVFTLYAYDRDFVYCKRFSIINGMIQDLILKYDVINKSKSQLGNNNRMRKNIKFWQNA